MSYVDETLLKPAGRPGASPDGTAPTQTRQLEINEQIRSGTLMLGEEIMKFKRIGVWEDRVRLMVPGHFEVMPEEYVALKYPWTNRPEWIFTNRNATVDLTFHHTASRLTDRQLEPFIRSMWEVLQKAQPSARLSDAGVREVGGRPLGFLEFVSPALDQAIYNLVNCTPLDERALLIGFNCLESLQERWRPIALGMLATLEILPPVQEGGSEAHD